MAGGRRWIWIGLIMALVPLGLWVLLGSPGPVPSRPGAGAGPGGGPAPPAPQATPAPIPPVQVERSAISTVDPQGRRQWEIRAATISVDGVAGTAQLTAVEGAFFQAGAMAVTFTAPRGTFYIATRNVTLAGGVFARSATGRTLEADVVRWYPRIRQVEATGSVVLRQQGIVVRADHLTADVALQRTKLDGNIRVEVAE
ncbi:MAG: LPS export ABC transporter periplasmic protein LptC [Armatimonadota bacterium]|nr:LPS export ABC transporter periplasmic protein LptC [Armatimonadota bacterium]MDR7519324.1 LPS export ABC transporter periplasmic protein LptC [Armatimonadota bacterium]